MRWPDIFFKSRKSRPVPEIATVPPRPAEPVRAPEKTELERAESARNEQEKAESLRALAESGSSGPRAVKGSPTAEKAPDSSNAKTVPLPVTPSQPHPVPRTGTGMSLRQRAKLTEDARVPLAPEPAADAPSKPVEAAKLDGAAAVVPAAFPVSVEAGSVLDKPPGAPTDGVPPASERSSPVTVEAKAPEEKPPTEPLPDLTAPANDIASRETARVHLAHATTSGPPTAIEPTKPDTRERTEFVLANGERIFGHVLSETPQTIYLDHGTLGVLTLPRSQIASKPIEVILINGDRIVGDLIAETPDCLYIKHASLGMLTVPHGQRSARVVEAILKDGDRILGEVLAETDNFTVIRSATLGTVAVQHEQVAMLNRKIEQMQLRAIPSNSPALEDKKDWRVTATLQR